MLGHYRRRVSEMGLKFIAEIIAKLLSEIIVTVFTLLFANDAFSIQSRRGLWLDQST
jgi:hypothetical protein